MNSCEGASSPRYPDRTRWLALDPLAGSLGLVGMLRDAQE
jgi:hypothetical protein